VIGTSFEADGGGDERERAITEILEATDVPV
jgi:hypothetical protein